MLGLNATVPFASCTGQYKKAAELLSSSLEPEEKVLLVATAEGDQSPVVVMATDQGIATASRTEVRALPFQTLRGAVALPFAPGKLAFALLQTESAIDGAVLMSTADAQRFTNLVRSHVPRLDGTEWWDQPEWYLAQRYNRAALLRSPDGALPDKTWVAASFVTTGIQLRANPVKTKPIFIPWSQVHSLAVQSEAVAATQPLLAVYVTPTGLDGMRGPRPGPRAFVQISTPTGETSVEVFDIDAPTLTDRLQPVLAYFETDNVQPANASGHEEPTPLPADERLPQPGATAESGLAIRDDLLPPLTTAPPPSLPVPERPKTNGPPVASMVVPDIMLNTMTAGADTAGDLLPDNEAPSDDWKAPAHKAPRAAVKIRDGPPTGGLVKWVSSWGAGTCIAVGVVFLFAAGLSNQQENAAGAQSPGSSGPGLLPAALDDLMMLFALVLIVSGVVKWWHQRPG